MVSIINHLKLCYQSFTLSRPPRSKSIDLSAKFGGSCSPLHFRSPAFMLGASPDQVLGIYGHYAWIGKGVRALSSPLSNPRCPHFFHTRMIPRHSRQMDSIAPLSLHFFQLEESTRLLWDFWGPKPIHFHLQSQRPAKISWKVRNQENKFHLYGPQFKREVFCHHLGQLAWILCPKCW